MDKGRVKVKTVWQSPSNIALIKYWGKKGDQLPANPSLSMTLSESLTRTALTVIKPGNLNELNFSFEGGPAPGFEDKIRSFINKISHRLPELLESSLKIESWNTFPHSAGIASSASSMSALALCICDAFTPGDERDPEFLRLASEISRMGSGSAGRSIYGGYCIWGESQFMNNTSDYWAVPLDFEPHSIFRNLRDSILIVSSSEKKISSSSGHALMENHPFANQRYEMANKNLGIILQAMKTGDFTAFIRIIEKEALVLHSLIMSSDPGFLLLEPGTLKIVNRIREYRESTGYSVGFTLDAGPNVHILYPYANSHEIEKFIKNELLTYCENGQVIWDKCGNGPEKL